jgi:SAM-dependent methyltransferase
MAKEWFEDWFDIKYYHILYKNRNYNEAENFIDNLLNYLKPKATDKFIDIACGKGRHSLFINKKGFPVVGYDLSKESVASAQKSAKKDLEFYVHDMRQIFRTNYFDFALNLFTSFGYFKSSRDELNAILSAAKNLKKGGILVVDFLNRDKVIAGLVPKETKTIEGIEFFISKEIKNNQVVKTIEFTDAGKKHKYKESVKLLSLSDFEGYLNKGNLQIKQVFGNYNLDLHSETSDRLIIIAQKVG